MPVRNVNVMPDNSRCDTHDKEYDVDDGSYLPRRPGGISDVTAESRKKGPISSALITLSSARSYSLIIVFPPGITHRFMLFFEESFMTALSMAMLLTGLSCRV